ncbi:hypothetical protein [Brevundimonas naejangsanensis]|uniref:hypothetical protein n=1 Tax=Brevundimonas naejangsanensis TaxID=588932 RepID=UPI0026EF18D5|nr:hypothetical protein [Brevundimonas naejangsanensis]
MSNVGKRGKLKLESRLRAALLNGTNTRLEHHEIERVIEALSKPQAREDAQPMWVDGVPTKHHAKEWFIAETTFGDRVVLTALPEEYTYDFKTADETYIKADRIKRWMPFPDSQYLFPHPAPDALREDLNRKHEACQIAQDQAMENGSRAREAERKLAEAVELLKQARSWAPTTGPLGDKISAFLSKEAERG